MQALRSEILIEVERNLAVRVRAQAMSGLLELPPLCLVTVELAVDDDLTAAILTCDGLTAGREVNNTEPRMPEPNAPVGGHPVALPIGTPVEETARRALQSSFR